MRSGPVEENDGWHPAPRRRSRAFTRIVVVIAAMTVAGGLASAKTKPPPKRDEPRQTATGCESIGEGYVKVPGSDTCVKVSGSARSEGAFIDRR